MSARAVQYEPAVGDDVEVTIRGRVCRVSHGVALIQRVDGEQQWLSLVDTTQIPTDAVTWRPTNEEDSRG